MTALPLEREWATLVQAYDIAAAALRDGACGVSCDGEVGDGACAAAVMRPGAALEAEPLTATSLQRMLAPVGSCRGAQVLHISAHGVADGLVLEEPARPLTAQLLSCQMLRDMLELRGHISSDAQQCDDAAIRGPQLVVLNACAAVRLGEEFVQGGVPHVVCSSVALRDVASVVFFRAFYSSLFQGAHVAAAFEASCVAVRGDADASVRACADGFRLLPEGGVVHRTALFPPSLSGMAPTPALPRRSLMSRSRSEPQDGYQVSAAPSSVLDVEAAVRESLVAGSSGDGGSSEEGGEARRLPCRRRGRARGFSMKASLSSASTAASSGGISGARPKRAQAAGSSASAAQRAGSVLGALGSPFVVSTPPLPEDFCGRSLDTWVVLQHLTTRRAVVVCAQEGQDRGIGKSAVLDSVHRAFALHVGGVCVAARLKPPPPPGAGANPGVSGALPTISWIADVRAAVLRAVRDCREQMGGSGAAGRGAVGRSARCMRRRLPKPAAGWFTSKPTEPGFHPISDKAAMAAALDGLAADLARLEELCEVRQRERPSASGRVLLLVDDCDHVIQQQHFQDAIADLLSSCASCRIVLCTHQRMVGTAGGRFKVVHHALQGLCPADAAQLVLRRAHRPLRWDEISAGEAAGVAATSALTSAMTAVGARSMAGPVVVTRMNEAAVFGLVGSHPAVAAQCGNPRRLIELASRVAPDLRSLADVLPRPAAAASDEHREGTSDRSKEEDSQPQRRPTSRLGPAATTHGRRPSRNSDELPEGHATNEDERCFSDTERMPLLSEE